MILLCINFLTRVLVPARARSPSLRIMGIFPGSKVMRGHNWKWGNQDGTMHTLLHRLSTVCVTVRLDIIIIIIRSIFKIVCNAQWHALYHIAGHFGKAFNSVIW